MAWNATSTLDTSTQDYAGYCLRFTQTAFDAPVAYPTAWDAWLAVDGKHEGDRSSPGVPVAGWFESWGTYGFGEYKNWGHACVLMPDGTLFSSPGSGYGNKWFASIEQAENQWGMRWVGWSEYLNGKQLAAWSADPAPAPAPTPSGASYTVQPGDCLSLIADAYGIAWPDLYAANAGIIGDNPNLIFPGQVLTIPGV